MRQVRKGDRLRVRKPAGAWEAWRGVVGTIFEDGATVVDGVQGRAGQLGACIFYDLTGFVLEDGTAIEPHPAVPCAKLAGGCRRNPVGACVRCGDEA